MIAVELESATGVQPPMKFEVPSCGGCRGSLIGMHLRLPPHRTRFTQRIF